MAKEVDTRKGCLSFRLPVCLPAIHLFFTAVFSFFHNQIVFQTDLIDLPIFPASTLTVRKAMQGRKKNKSLFSCNKLHLEWRILSMVS